MSHRKPPSPQFSGNSPEAVNSAQGSPFPSHRFLLNGRFLSAPPHSRGDPSWRLPRPIHEGNPLQDSPICRFPEINSPNVALTGTPPFTSRGFLHIPNITPRAPPHSQGDLSWRRPRPIQEGNPLQDSSICRFPEINFPNVSLTRTSPFPSHGSLHIPNITPTAPPQSQGMMKTAPTNVQVEISSDDSSSSDADIDNLLNDEPSGELSSEAWLFRRAQSYQEYMKAIPIPNDHQSVILCNTWAGLGKAMKHIYEQPLHYLTNLHLKQLDQARRGGMDESVPLDRIIHPVKAETSVWVIEEIHRLTASPHHLLELWKADPRYHAYIDDIFPKLP